MNKIIITLFFIIFNFAISAKSDVILIVGKANRDRYGSFAYRLLNSNKKRSEDVGSFTMVAGIEDIRKKKAEDETNKYDRVFLNFEKKSPNRFVSFNNSKSISDSFKKMSTGSGDVHNNATIYISDHGGSKKKSSNFMDATISTYTSVGKPYTYRHLHRSIKSNLKDRKFVRLAASHCYGGNVHEVAFKLSNTCVAASTDRHNLNTSTVANGSQYAVAGIEEQNKSSGNKEYDINNDGYTSLHETHIAGILSDTYNYVRAQTSTMAFIDYTLKQGAYSDDASKGKLGISKHIDPILQCIDGKSDQSIDNFVSNLEDVLNKDSNTILNSTLSNEELSELPKELQQSYQFLMKNKRVKEAISSDYIKIGNLQKSINSYKSNYTDILKSIKDERDPTKRDALIKKRNKLIELVEKKQTSIDRASSITKGVENYIRTLKSYSQFTKLASNEQKEQFNNLLECEVSSL